MNIILGKAVRANDNIIWNGRKWNVTTATKGLGAGNEFGTYIHGAAISSDGVLNTFWIYENCPIVRMKTS